VDDMFFPIALVASGISLSAPIAVVSGRLEDVMNSWWREPTRLTQLVMLVNVGIFVSLGGALLWIYLLVGSFSSEVRALVPWHPLLESSAYYLLSMAVNEWKAKTS
jgi:hypothetical protein